MENDQLKANLFPRAAFDNSVSALERHHESMRMLSIFRKENNFKDKLNPEYIIHKKIWTDHCELTYQLEEALASVSIALLRSTPPPQLLYWIPSKSEVRRLFSLSIVDVMNIDGASELDRIFNEGYGSWFSADKQDITNVFGKPHRTFKNHDGQFGMWWLKTKAGTLYNDERTFVICAGPTGMRCGTLKPISDPSIDTRFRVRSYSNLSKYDELIVCWFQQWVWQTVRKQPNPPLDAPAWILRNP